MTTLDQQLIQETNGIALVAEVANVIRGKMVPLEHILLLPA